MEWTEWAALILVMIACIGVGLVWGWFWHKRLTRDISSGVLKIDTSDPDGPYLFLELHEEIGAISKQNHVTFEVDLSQ